MLIGYHFKINVCNILGRSETNHDRAKTCMTGQHDRPLSKTYSKPHPLSSTHSKGDYQSYCWPYSTWLCVIGTPMGQTFLIHVLRPGGEGYFMNFGVGMCRWDPGTLNLY